MKTKIKIYENIVAKVKFFYKQLQLEKLGKSTGRPLTISIIETISLFLFKQKNGIPTKKEIHEIFNLKCSYKTLVVNMNRLTTLALLILSSILKWNKGNSHLIKHTDSTDIPVCLNKNAKYHKIMHGFAEWGHSGKGWYYGLKLHITTDLNRKILAISFTPANKSDRAEFMYLNKNLNGLFVADAGYVSNDLAKKFHIEDKRILFAKPRANMKKIITEFQKKLYDTRMIIELNFRSLKMFYSLITSMPRSVDGYLANYIYSLLAFVCA